MKKWLIISPVLAIFIALLFLYSKSDETINSSFNISMRYDNNEFRIIPYLKINNVIKFNNYSKDTLILSFNKTPHWTNSIKGTLIDSLNYKITEYDNDSSDIVIAYNSKEGTISIINRDQSKKDFTLTIDYYYKYQYNSILESFKNQFATINCDVDYCNWFLINPNLTFNYIKIDKDDKYRVICNNQLINKTDKSYTYDISTTPYSDINIMLINDLFYKEEKINIGKHQFRVNMLKTYSPDVDSINKVYVIDNEREHHKNHYDSIINSFIKYVKPLASKFSYKSLDTDIFEVKWRSDNAKQYYGRGYSGGNGFIRCDMRFFYGSGIAHEILHKLCNVEGDIKAPGFLFINESIIEAFTIYACYGDNKEQMDSVFTNLNKRFYDKGYSDTISLFKIESNSNPVWGKVYYKTPYDIYMFSKKRGNEEFWNILNDFMIQDIKDCKWIDFYNFFIERGLSKDELNKLKEVI
ncbi:MAG: hypothetical protein N4A72_23045 [Bacteroidales bacterium]|jgi:hypothetical protein|nr:hypothetical protein [Bacteroidales bacterium]